KAPPKTTGRELFNHEFLERVPGEGAVRVANATALTAHTMARAYVDFVLKRGRRLNAVFVAGGGALNPTLVMLFASELHRLARRKIFVGVLPEVFAPPQYLEAMAFARLGYEALQGNPVSLASVTGANEDALGAGIFPGRNYQALLGRVLAKTSRR
ncbi:MAG: anhydro-N-acetylmuramic acid kinase, partial [Deltaproteobacteria bacterium]|nr:anhydro-N-acetylmuramic acid kinase [Deltaproteobacteria bacterium]